MFSSNKPKPKVFYRVDKPHQYQVGRAAICCPINHPNPKGIVTSDGETPVETSPVVAVDHISGQFWTANTHYIPHPSFETADRL